MKTHVRKLQTQESGFTLLEVLVVVFIVGILAAIAAPGWLAFVNGQRLNVVRDQVVQTLRSAQSKAQVSKQNQTIVFDNSTDPPTIIINPNVENVQEVLGNGEIKANLLTLTAEADGTPNDTVAFDQYGNVNADSVPYQVTIAIASNPNSKKCVIVQTILGAITTKDGNDCN
mgnify:CR=1 FL=1